MKISSFNNNQNIKNNSLTFTGNNLAERYAKAEKDFKTAVKTKAGKATFENLNKELSAIEKDAKSQIKEGKTPKIFVNLVKWFGKIKPHKTGNKNVDTASQLARFVLWGNIGKEVAGTIFYTVQALTNQDLPPDKRKFVGMYDLFVGIVSTSFSLLFLVADRPIQSGYRKVLKPLSESKNAATRARAGAAIVGISAFTSFAAQMIIGKRIIAPAVATPVAGKLKKHMEAKEAKKAEESMSPFPAEALILAQNAQNRK